MSDDQSCLYIFLRLVVVHQEPLQVSVTVSFPYLYVQRNEWQVIKVFALRQEQRSRELKEKRACERPGSRNESLRGRHCFPESARSLVSHEDVLRSLSCVTKYHVGKDWGRPHSRDSNEVGSHPQINQQLSLQMKKKKGTLFKCQSI